MSNTLQFNLDFDVEEVNSGAGIGTMSPLLVAFLFPEG